MGWARRQYMFFRNEAVRNFRLASNVATAAGIVMGMQLLLAKLGAMQGWTIMATGFAMMVPLTIILTWGTVAVMRTRKAYDRHRNTVRRLHGLLLDEETDSGSDYKLPPNAERLYESKAREVAALAMASAARRKLQAEAGGMRTTQLQASNRLYELGELVEDLGIAEFHGERADAEWYLRKEEKRRADEMQREKKERRSTTPPERCEW